MSTRTAVTVVGGIIGAFYGYPQAGLLIGSLVGGAVDPTRIEGPQINETGTQTSAEGVQRPVVWGTIDVTGNIMHKGPSVKVEREETQGKGGAEVVTNYLYRSFAIRICEGPISQILRVWEDNKLVYDMRAGSAMTAESQKWLANKVVYVGDETQVADPTLVALDADAPSHRGTAYIVFILEDLTERAGSISQYRFEVAKEVSTIIGAAVIGPNNGLYVTDISADGDGNLLMLRSQTGGSPAFGVGAPSSSGTYTIATLDKNNINTEIDTITFGNGGDPLGSSDERYGVIGISPDPQLVVTGGSLGTNSNFSRIVQNGTVIAHLADETANLGWNTNDDLNGTPPLFGGGIYFFGVYLYYAINRGAGTKLMRYVFPSTGASVGPGLTINDAFPAASPIMVNVSRAGIVRVMKLDGSDMKEYDHDFIFLGNRTPPTLPAIVSGIYGFGFDDTKGLQVYIFMPTGSTLQANIYDLSGNLLSTKSLGSHTATGNRDTKVIFTDENIFVKRHHTVYSIAIPNTYTGIPTTLGVIVSDIYKRCGIDETMFDVSELTDTVDGLVCANAYTGADAITKLIQWAQFDISAHDRKNWHPKRGAAVIETLTVNDILELPDTNTREQAIERPKKLHLRYKHAASGYAAVKATAPRANSPDVLTTGEAIIELPIVMDENVAARKADVMYKIVSTEVSGETEISVPFRIGAKYVTGNALGLSLRGQTTRQRIDRIEFTPWRIKLTLKPDRQSAYTSNLTGVPIPPPELPPSTIVGDTQMAVLDISARVESEDDLNYLVAVSGRLPPWYGARYQRSIDGGATYSSVLDINTPSIMGELTNTVTDASEHYTDTTNVLQVELYRDSQSLSSISDVEFLSAGNPCAVEKADGSWELMQFQEAEQASDGTWTLSILHRGQLNSGTSSHAVGARFIMLQRPSHIPAQSAWIGQDLTHRAISFGESADDTDNEETHEYVGRSQIEWEPAYLDLKRDVGTNAITATWQARGRFGTDMSPVLSANFRGFRVTATDGVTTETIETTDESYSGTWASPVTITVVALNRITGAGPASTGTV